MYKILSHPFFEKGTDLNFSLWIWGEMPNKFLEIGQVGYSEGLGLMLQMC
jgi:hypothetical protein